MYQHLLCTVLQQKTVAQNATIQLLPCKFSTFSILFNAKLRYSSFFNLPTFSKEKDKVNHTTLGTFSSVEEISCQLNLWKFDYQVLIVVMV